MTDQEFKSAASAAFRGIGIAEFEIVVEPKLIGARCRYQGQPYEVLLERARPQDAASHLPACVDSIARLPQDVRLSQTRGRPRQPL